MAEIVYILCALASLACTTLLLRDYRRTRVGLLLWSGLCFLGLFFNNVLLLVDLVLIPHIDLSAVRLIPASLGIAVLIFGLIWETTE